MKNVFYIMSLVLSLSLLATSCVKEYTCQCEVSFEGRPGLPEPFIREYKLSNTLEKAQDECRSRSQTYEDGGVYTTEKCDLY